MPRIEMMQAHFKKKSIILGILVAVVILEAGIFFQDKDLNLLRSSLFRSDLSLREHAEEIVARCAQERYRPSCYDREIPTLMGTLSMEDAFRVTAIVQERDQSYQYCHVSGHELSAREVKKDPTKWKDVVSRCPSGLCSNGCIHGGFQERFRAEYFTDEEIAKLKPDLEDLCEERGSWHPTKLEQASCYHALGHLTMYLTNADLDKSSGICDEVALKSDGRNFRHLCYDGVYMQIFQPLEPEDFALVKGKQPKKEEVPDFCGRFSGEKKASCLTESWPLFREELQSPEGLVRFCSLQEPQEKRRCYDALVYVLTAQFNFDVERIQNYCRALPHESRGRCFANAASRMIETDYRNIDKSVTLCASASAFDKNGECFKELVFYSDYNFHPGSDEFFKLCRSLPEPWKAKCLEK